jgi:hypothetical protein
METTETTAQELGLNSIERHKREHLGMTTEPPVPPVEGGKERFTITSEKDAVWLLTKLRKIAEDRDAIKAATTQRVAELDADENQLKHLYEEQLKAWAAGESEKRRRQTITVPLAGMQVAFRKTAAALFVADPVKAAEEAMARGLVKTTPDLSSYRAEAEAWLEQTGDILPGFDRKPEGQSFSWRPIKAGKGAEATEAE